MLNRLISYTILCLLLAFQSPQAVAQCVLTLTEAQEAALQTHPKITSEYGSTSVVLRHSYQPYQMQITVEMTISTDFFPGQNYGPRYIRLSQFMDVNERQFSTQCPGENEFIFKEDGISFDNEERWTLKPKVVNGKLEVEMWASGELKYTLKDEPKPEPQKPPKSYDYTLKGFKEFLNDKGGKVVFKADETGEYLIVELKDSEPTLKYKKSPTEQPVPIEISSLVDDPLSFKVISASTGKELDLGTQPVMNGWVLFRRASGDKVITYSPVD